jgi:hypothetical protein
MKPMWNASGTKRLKVKNHMTFKDEPTLGNICELKTSSVKMSETYIFERGLVFECHNSPSKNLSISTCAITSRCLALGYVLERYATW